MVHMPKLDAVIMQRHRETASCFFISSFSPHFCFFFLLLFCPCFYNSLPFFSQMCFLLFVCTQSSASLQTQNSVLLVGFSQNHWPQSAANLVLCPITAQDGERAFMPQTWRKAGHVCDCACTCTPFSVYLLWSVGRWLNCHKMTAPSEDCQLSITKALCCWYMDFFGIFTDKD